jgi:uncharacterized SAM-binding protein YcdF (DUF218 family)
MGPAEALLQPPGLVWVALLVVSLLAFRKKAPAAGLLALAAAGWIWAIGATPLSANLLAGLERPYARTNSAPLPTGDAVLMLGGAVGFSSRELLWFGAGEATDRVLTAVEMMRQRRARVLVLSGSSYEWNGQRRPDAEIVAAWMQAWRLPVGELVLLPASVDTHDEAVNMAALIRTRGWRRVIMISSAYHLRRSTAVFRKAGVEVVPQGCDFLGVAALDSSDPKWRIVPRPDNLKLFSAWLHEELGLAWYWWKGWT